MTVLSRYTWREIVSHFSAVLAVILGIFLIRRFAALLADATEGSLPMEAILSLLALRTLMSLPALMPVVLYLAVLLALARLHQDQEMTALAGCGVPARRVYAAAMGLAAAIAVLIAALSFSVRPWAALRYDRVKNRAMSESGLNEMRPGRFYTAERRGGEVFFADGRSKFEPGVLEDVFVQRQRKGRLSVFVARRAVERRDEAEGYRFLQLFDGYRYDLDTEDADHQITRYAELSLRTPLGDSGAAAGDADSRSADELLRSSDPRDAAELQWRLSMPVSALLLVLLALPLSHTTPRQGKYARILIAVLLYVGYRNLLGAARSWVSEGAWSPLPGLWVMHALCLVVALLLFALEPDRRQRWAWRLGRRRAAAAGASGSSAPR